MMSLLYVLGAVLALSFLVFIHELGHYWMARRTGMKVETFSIGFGRPLFSWLYQGVKWQIGWLPFGGYVKIAGMDGEPDKDPYEVKDGFFGKSPLDRMKVAFMGPFVNIVFALLAFALLWAAGGRLKSFSEFTTKSGWIDPASELYQDGVRPGDEVLSYNGKSYEGINDLVYVGLTSSGPVKISGNKVNALTGVKEPFAVEVSPYPHPAKPEKGLMTLGVLQPASFLIYDKLANGNENPLPPLSPMQGSGLQYGDRIVWVDGHLIYSSMQLSNLLNDGRALLTVQRAGKNILSRVPRVQVQELKFDPEVRAELTDWQHAAGLEQIKFVNLLTLPYNLNNEGVVENQVRFIDADREEKAFPKNLYSSVEAPLEAGDKIIAVDGIPVTHSSDILKAIQGRKSQVIVERPSQRISLVTWQNADALFDAQTHAADIEKIAATIGSAKPLEAQGSLQLLKPAALKTYREIFLESEQPGLIGEELIKQRRAIEGLEDPQQRAQLLQALNERESQYALGVPFLRDLKVQYNPVPTDQFMQVFNEIARTVKALFTGSLSPKWLSGPVGIVYMFQEQTRSSLSDGLYWLGLISLNLGVLNLLPIPMLDGGTIVLSLLEWITGKRIPPKTLEKLILPFAILLIILFLYWTYNDISRIFGGFLRK